MADQGLSRLTDDEQIELRPRRQARAMRRGKWRTIAGIVLGIAVFLPLEPHVIAWLGMTRGERDAAEGAYLLLLLCLWIVIRRRRA